MLQVPRYLECCLLKVPMVPLRKNHKTQGLFVLLFCLILLSQLVVILPAQSNAVLAYLIFGLSCVLAICFFKASVTDPGYLRPEHSFL